MTQLDQLLQDALHDDRLALPVPAGTLDAVRRKRRTRQRLAVTGASAGVLAVAGGVLGAAVLLRSPAATLSPYSSGLPAGSPAPGITPAFVPQTGRDWLLTQEQWTAFTSGHTRPSPPPGQSRVASPAPLAGMSAQLLADVEAGVFRDDTTMRREDAVGGQPGTAAVHVTLTGGVPVEVFRTQLVEPTSLEQNGPGTDTDATVVDVPGTTSAAGLYPTYGYGFPGFTGNAHQVMVVTRGGIATIWDAPDSVSLETLKAWAFAAARHSGD